MHVRKSSNRREMRTPPSVKYERSRFAAAPVGHVSEADSQTWQLYRSPPNKFSPMAFPSPPSAPFHQEGFPLHLHCEHFSPTG